MTEPYGCECRLDRVGCSQVTPVFGWEVVKRKQYVSVFGKALAGRWILGLEFLEELIEGFLGVVFGFCLPDFV